jgi:hypothetical protein
MINTLLQLSRSILSWYANKKKSPQEMVIKEYSYGLILTFTGNIAT